MSNSVRSSVVNKSGLKPLGRAVLLEPYEPERYAGKIIMPENARERSMMLEVRGIVVAIGEFAWPDEPARAKVGDKVMVSKWAGDIVNGPLDGKRYRMVNGDDVYCAIVEEATA
jgi:chaperonin GroES